MKTSNFEMTFFVCRGIDHVQKHFYAMIRAIETVSSSMNHQNAHTDRKLTDRKNHRVLLVLIRESEILGRDRHQNLLELFNDNER